MCDPVRAAAADFSHEPFCEEGKAEPGLIFETVALRRIKGQGNVPAHRLGDSAQGLGAALERSAGIKGFRSEEHTSELQSLMRISYAVFCLKKKNQQHKS